MLNNNIRNVYDSMDKLCRIFDNKNHKEILKKVTGKIAENHQNFFFSNLQFDESIIVSKIKDHLRSKNEKNLIIFIDQYQELLIKTQPKFRSSILTFLLYLSDMESKLPSTTRIEDTTEKVDDVFVLPKSRSITTSSSMHDMHRELLIRVNTT
jgi:hypothetical protein